MNIKEYILSGLHSKQLTKEEAKEIIKGFLTSQENEAFQPPLRQENISDLSAQQFSSLTGKDALLSDPQWDFLIPGQPNYDEGDATISRDKKIELFLGGIVADQIQVTVDQIDNDLSFFELGLSSTGLVSLIKEIERVVRSELPPTLLFDYISIGDLGGYLSEKYALEFDSVSVRRALVSKRYQNNSSRHASMITPFAISEDHLAPTTSKTNRPEKSPLSEPQEGLWALQKMHPGLTAYNCPLCFKLNSEINVDLMETAVRRLVKQYPILGTVVHEAGGCPYQEAAPADSFVVEVEDLSHLELSGVTQLLKDRANTPFVFGGEPLFRVNLFKRSSKENIILITVHHMIFDGGSIYPLVNTLFDFYQTLRNGNQPVMRSNGEQYKDFIARQQVMLEGVLGERCITYWRDELKEPLPTLDFPTDYPRSQSKRFQGASHQFVIDKAAATQLRDFSSKNQCYLSTTFLAVFKLLLHRYARQDDLIIGMPYDERGQGEFTSEIGFFINMLPIRSIVSPDTSFKQFIRKLQKTIVSGIAHSYPFTSLLRELKIPISSQHNPIYQAAFFYQNFSGSGAFQALESKYRESLSVQMDQEIAQEGEYELALEIYETENDFVLNLKYNPSLYRSSTIKRLGEQYRRLVTSVPTSPGARLSDFTLLSEQQEKALIHDWNRTKQSYPTDQCFYQLFEAQAQKTPDALAIEFGDKQYTYRELDEKCTVLGCYLQSIGIKPNQVVTLFVDRSIEMVIGLLGIQKSGGAYVALDPGYPIERLGYILEDCGSTTLLTQASIKPSLYPVLKTLPNASSGKQMRVISFDAEWQEIQQTARNHKLTPHIQPTDLAYVLYTSGSTGKPKGVKVSHRNLVNFLCSMAQTPGFKKGDYLLALTTINFDISALELYLPLMCGGTVGLVGADTTQDGFALRELVEHSRATVIQATPSTWRMLLAAGWDNTRSQIKLLCGGEALTEELGKELLMRSGSVWNMYGPTETTVWSSVFPVVENEKIYIGKPIANTSFYVLDQGMNPLPIGVPGELYIGGDGVAQGYHNLPELSSERFLADPFTTDPLAANTVAERNEATMYRTGDLVRTTPNGDFEYLGRIDNQVKIRGYRIELGEIESCFTRINGIDSTIVLKREDSPGHEGLVAFLKVDGRLSERDKTEISYTLRSQLPDYMVPHRWVVLSSFPLTPNQKVDLKYLSNEPIEAIENSFGPGHENTILTAATIKHPVLSKSLNNGNGHERLETSLIDDLTDIVADVVSLSAASISKDKHLGEYGFDSIRFTRFSLMLNQRYGLETKPTAFFNYPTLNKIACYLVNNYGGIFSNHYGMVSHEEWIEDEAELPPESVSPKIESPDNTGRVSSAADRRSIAIIGMAGQFPHSNDLQEFWSHLNACDDLVGDFPSVRDGVDNISTLSNTESVKPGIFQGGYIRDVDCFDAAFFNISGKEAELMDPQQRLLLQSAWSAIEDAGYRASDLAGSDTGVFVGVIGSDYQSIVTRNLSAADGHAITGTASSIVCNRLSYYFDFKGPSASIDTACSSSLVAIHRGVEAIRNGACEMALAGGTNLILRPEVNLLLNQSGMLSPDGRCKSFDSRANGYVRGEGLGLLLLKRLDKALDDSDTVYGIIKGSAENHGGRVHTLTAPNPQAQTEVLAKAYRDAGVDPKTVSYIETHGTGTPLGDPIEVSGLKHAFEQLYRDWGYPSADKSSIANPHCALGSVKTNIGHLEASAGLAGVVKVILALKNKSLPGNIHFTELNPVIEIDRSPFYINAKSISWEASVDEGGKAIPRRAGVSSFGMGGANAHIVIEESVRSRPEHCLTGEPVIILLSARNSERLQIVANNLALAVDSESFTDADLPRIAYTLQVGREPMAERLAFIVNSIEALESKLLSYTEDTNQARGFYRFSVKGNDHTQLDVDEDFQLTVDAWVKKGKYDKLLKLWAKGFDIDWRILYGTDTPDKINLPTYPFVKERYWMQPLREIDGDSGNLQAGTANLHPLVQANTSDFSEQRYSSVFSGREFFLADHVLGGEPLLPGVSYLEMIRVAATQALGESAVSGEVSTQLRNVVWLRPFIVSGQDRTLHIRLLPQDDEIIRFEVFGPDGDGEEQLFCQGDVTFSPSEPKALEHIIREGRSNHVTKSAEQCYMQFAALGFEYGPAYQGIECLYLGDDQVLAKIQMPSVVGNTLDNYLLHPSLLDAALQSTIGFIFSDQGSDGSVDFQKTTVPFALNKLTILDRLTEQMWVVVRRSEGGKPDDVVQKFDIDLCRENGAVCVEIKEYSSRVIDRPDVTNSTTSSHSEKKQKANAGLSSTLQTSLYRPVWEQSSAITNDSTTNDSTNPFVERRVILIEPEISQYEELKAHLGSTQWGHLTSSETDLDQRFKDYSMQLMLQLKRVFEAKPKGVVLVQVVVLPSQPYRSEIGLFSALSGLLKSAQMENTRLRGQLVDLSDEPNISLVSQLLDTNSQVADSDHIRYRKGAREILSWDEIPATDTVPTSPFKQGGVYLITGGAGGLGLHFAQEIVYQAPKTKVILAGRSALSDMTNAELDKVVSKADGQSAHIEYRQTDVSDRASVEALIQFIETEYGQLSGIIHGAGTLRDSLISHKTLADLDSVLAPKVSGLVNLDQATQAHKLDFFVLFSSVSSVFGNAGQADYAMANGFMDAFSYYRNAMEGKGERYGQCVAINWPLWRAGGMSVDSDIEDWMTRNTGIVPLETKPGLAAFGQAIASKQDQVLVLNGNKVVLQNRLLGLPIEITEEESIKPVVSAGAAPEIDKDSILNQVIQIIASAVKAPLERIHPDTPFEKLGMDSILQVTVIKALEEITGTLPKTLMFEYTTAEELRDYLLENHAGQFSIRETTVDVAVNNHSAREKDTAIASLSQHQSRSNRLKKSNNIRPSERSVNQTTASMIQPVSEIAIIGLSGRYPHSSDISTFWDNLKQGENCITSVHGSHWQMSIVAELIGEATSSQTKHYNGGFLSNRDGFDHYLFELSSQETQNLSPELRLFLETVWETFEDAGYAKERIKSVQSKSGKGIAVYVGSMYNQHAWTMPTIEDAVFHSNGTEWQLANRVSHFFDLKGPSMAVNSACSSSLTAIHLACESLKLNNCSMAIAGGVNLTLDPSKYTLLESVGFLEQGGRSKSFGQAEGYVPGEGVGAVLLKPLQDALDEGDQILGLVKSSGVNHGGGRQMYSVPDPQQQTQLITDTIKQAGIDARSINYVESAANGSPLGDPIEIVALNKAFKQFTDDKQFCAIGTVKSNIGHLEAASGISQVSKVLLQLRNNTLVPSINAHPMNPNIELEHTPFYLQESATPWQPLIDKTSGKALQRRCLINSFGAGGAYASLIIEEYPDTHREVKTVAGHQENAFLFSAKTSRSLKEYLVRMVNFLSQESCMSDTDVARTLATVNHNLEHRLAIVADSLNDLANKISHVIDGEQIAGIYDSKATPSNRAEGGLAQRCLSWAAGKNVDVNTFEINRSSPYFRPFNFPKYAFDHGSMVSEQGQTPSIATEVYHHDEPFLRDHTVYDQRMLIGATYGSLATNGFFDRHPGQQAVEIQSLQFIEPVTLKAGQQVEVTITTEQNQSEGPFQAKYRFTPHDSWKTASTGRLHSLDFKHETRDVDLLKSQLSTYYEIENLYKNSAFVGSGESFQTVTELYLGDEQALARVVLTDDSLNESHSYHSHPLIAYSGFVAMMTALQGQRGEESYLPFGMNGIQVLKGHPLTECWLHTELVKISSEIILYDATVIDDNHQVVARFNGCSFKRFRAAQYIKRAQHSRSSVGQNTLTSTDLNVVSSSVGIARDSAISVERGSSTFKGDDLRSAIEGHLISKVEALFPHVSGSLSVDTNLMDLGLESNQLIKLTSSIEQEANIRLTATLLFEYPNISELSGHFTESHSAEFLPLVGKSASEHSELDTITSMNAAVASAPETFSSPISLEVDESNIVTPEISSKEATAVSTSNKSRDIAVIGMHGRFSGAESLDQFWKNITNEVNLMEEVPIEHWDVRPWFNEDPSAQDMTYCKWGSFIDDFDKFDAMFFKISPREAEWMDPQGRLLLESIYSSAEDAGYSRQLRGSNIGVFVASSPLRYSERIYSDGVGMDPYLGTGNTPAAFSNRISFVFDLQGPSQSIDTACSSALTALVQACLSLRNKECPMAFVGGANLLLSSQHYRYFSSLGALSHTGRCHTFDANADGYTPGECIGSVMLKPLDDAERDGDRIHAVIKGGAALHGGYTPSLTAPSVKGEENVILKAWEDAGINPETLGYIEAHGTGTPLGDPIEIHALAKAFSRYTNKQHFCVVGSAKANIGHSENASGITGILKVIQQLKNRLIPALPAFKQLNPNIQMAQSALYINDELQEWTRPEGSPCRAGISAFGFTGGFAHVVLEEYPVTNDEALFSAVDSYPCVVLLSAKDSDRLQQQVNRLAEAISTQSLTEDDLPSIVYTLQVGREMMQCRLALMVSSISELVQKLGEVATASETSEGISFGQSVPKRVLSDALNQQLNNGVGSWQSRRDLRPLVDLWCEGIEVDWHQLYGDNRPQVMTLPTYPFARVRHWVQSVSQKQSGGEVGANLQSIHPLLHENTSNLSGQRFTSTFTGQEFFLNDHQVKGQKILPGVCYLEMARKAMEKVSGPTAPGTSLFLNNVVWLQPLIVGSVEKEVHISLFGESTDSVEYEVYTHSENGDDVVHSQGRAEFKTSVGASVLDLAALRSNMNAGRLEAETCYQAFSSAELNLGAGLRGISEIYQGNDEILARFTLPESVQQTQQDYVLHPSLMDAAFQSPIGLVLDRLMSIGDDDRSFSIRLPFALDSVEIIAPCTAHMYAWIRQSKATASSNKAQRLDIDLCDEQGNVCVSMRGVTLRSLGKEAAETFSGNTIATINAIPAWQARPIIDNQIQPRYSEHLVLVCEMPFCEKNSLAIKELESRVTGSQCLKLSSYEHSIGERFTDYTIQCLAKIRDIFARKSLGDVLIQILIPDSSEQSILSALSGLLKTARLENPKIHWQVIQADPEASLDMAVAKLKENENAGDNANIKYSNETRLISSWQELQASTNVTAIPLKKDRVYLITGGMGGLGLHFAKEFLKNSPDSKLILTGRSELSAEKQTFLNELDRLQGQVSYHAVDVSRPEQVGRLIERILSEYGQLDGILHCAGVNADSFIVNKTEDEVRRVLSPKVSGTLNLDKATQHIALEFFVLFSSTVGATGNLGQADYAAANGFMDQFSGYRNQMVESGLRQGRTVSINWPLWKEGGMRVDAASESKMMASAGMSPMLTGTGIQAFYQSLTSKHPQILVMEGKTSVMRNYLFAETAAQSIHPLSKSEVTSYSGVVTSNLATTSRGTPEIDGVSLLKKIQLMLIEVASATIKIDAKFIDLDKEMSDYGFDSITLTGIANQLNKQYSLSLTPAVFFEYTTLGDFAEYLAVEFELVFVDALLPLPTKIELNKVSNAQVEATVESKNYASSKRKTGDVRAERETKPDLHVESIAVIGMSGCFPGAEDLDQFWRNLVNEKDCISEIPSDRWNWSDLYGDPYQEENKTDIKWGGFIQSVADFDPLFFGISPREAELMDPQQRLLMTYVYQVIEEAGYSPNSLSGSNTGIFVGTGSSGYSGLIAKAGVAIEGYSATGMVPSVGPNRMSYFLNFHGPSEPVETACSSALVAIHRAVGAMNDGDCDAAIVGGVNTIVAPEGHISFSKAGMLSKDGRCKTFSSSANGYVRGEGVGMLFLKKRSQAVMDGDHIYGVIKGTAENHGGRANSLTAPNPNAQAQLIQSAHKKSGIDPATISYIEAHGTGTELGDPIEINGLKKAFKELYRQHGYGVAEKAHCGIGSVKTNIGHLELAAGIAGVIKVLLQFKHKKLVKSLYSEEINPYIDLKKSPFYIVKETSNWERLTDINGQDIPRRAGVSSFGFGGVNAHIVLEEYVGNSQDFDSGDYKRDGVEPVMVVLSAQNDIGLQQRARDLLTYTQSVLLSAPQRIPESPCRESDQRMAELSSLLGAEFCRHFSLLLNIDREYIDPTHHFSDLGVEVYHLNEVFEFITDDLGLEVRLNEVLEQNSIQSLVDVCIPLHPEFNREIEVVSSSSESITSVVDTSSSYISTNLASIAYTLQVGREAMEARLGLLVSSMEELRQKLEDFIAGTQLIEGCYQGQVESFKDTVPVIDDVANQNAVVERWMVDKRYSELLDSWVKGLSVNWEKLYDDFKPGRISLPTYPFAKDRYWVSNSRTDNNQFTSEPKLDKSIEVEELVDKLFNDLKQKESSHSSVLEKYGI